MANPIVIGVISLVIAVIMVANVLIPIIKGTNTSQYTTVEVSLFGLVSIASFVGLMYSAFAIWGLA